MHNTSDLRPITICPKSTLGTTRQTDLVSANSPNYPALAKIANPTSGNTGSRRFPVPEERGGARGL